MKALELSIGWLEDVLTGRAQGAQVHGKPTGRRSRRDRNGGGGIGMKGLLRGCVVGARRRWRMA